MKIKELISKLSELDQDLEVFVHGYEGGLESVDEIGDETEVALNVNEDWFYGPHEEERHLLNEQKGKFETIKGIIIK